jgi:hypothetical protein
MWVASSGSSRSSEAVRVDALGRANRVPCGAVSFSAHLSSRWANQLGRDQLMMRWRFAAQVRRARTGDVQPGLVTALPAAGEEILRARSDDGVVTLDVDGTMRLRRGEVELTVGPFAPPLLASVPVAAVAGGVIGEFAGSPRPAGHPRQF